MVPLWLFFILLFLSLFTPLVIQLPQPLGWYRVLVTQVLSEMGLWHGIRLALRSGICLCPGRGIRLGPGVGSGFNFRKSVIISLACLLLFFSFFYFLAVTYVHAEQFG